MREVRWERMFPDQLEQAFAACPLLYLTYGLCEPHGPQNVVGLDTLKAHKLACRAAQAHGGIVAPPYAWHIHELGGEASWSAEWIGNVARSWLTAVPPWLFYKNVCYHIRAADALGFHAVVLLTGHYSAVDFRTVLDLIQPYTGARLYALPDYEANQPGFDGDGRSGGDHAGRIETSLLWALEPNGVDFSRLPSAEAAGPHFAMGPRASQANRRIGERMVEDIVAYLGARGRELLANYARTQPTQRLQTFEDVEVLWEAVVRPHVASLRTMQDLWEGQTPPPTDSVWFANWRVPKWS